MKTLKTNITDKGFRVVGPNSCNGDREEWYFPDLKFAKAFATQTATDVEAEYDIYRHIATVRRVPRPVECIDIDTKQPVEGEE